MKQIRENTYFSNGNLLISGEYFVLIGAKALAIPLKHGQQMKVRLRDNENKAICWEAFELDQPWFKTEFSSANLDIIHSTHKTKAIWLQKVLRTIADTSEAIEKNKSYHITCHIQFNTNWGWGSSSSLICNLASWANMDPFKLNATIFPGSGYDIAASSAQSPIYYQLIDGIPQSIPAGFNPGSHDAIRFVYLGKKQNTAASIRTHQKAILRNKEVVKRISCLTEKMAEENNPNEFIGYITEHEKIISKTLKMPTLKEKFFSDFDGGIKSLGSWGGDFMIAVSQQKDPYIKEYFKNKRLETVFRLDEIMKN